MKHVHPWDVQDDPVQQPKQPNLPPNGYIVILLKFIYSNISICQSCGGKFYLNFFKPTLTRKEIYIVSKTKGVFVNPEFQERAQSNEFSNVYFTF